MSVQRFVDALRALPDFAGVFNPWRDHDSRHDGTPDAPSIRASNLTRYLEERAGRAKFLLVAEAPGYQGCHFSGIAMTSERILLDRKPAVPADAVFAGPKQRTSRADVYPDGANEPTATIVWGLLLGLGLDPRDFVLWNAFPCHPHRAGDTLTNRAPAREELAAAAHVLPQMIELLPGAQVLAVGRVAEGALARLGVAAPAVRHPAMGGADRFREQMKPLLRA